MAVISTIVASIFGLICTLAVYLAGGGTTHSVLAYVVSTIGVYVLLQLRNRYVSGEGLCCEHEIAADLLALHQRDEARALFPGKPVA